MKPNTNWEGIATDTVAGMPLIGSLALSRDNRQPKTTTSNSDIRHFGNWNRMDYAIAAFFMASFKKRDGTEQGTRTPADMEKPNSAVDDSPEGAHR